MSARWASSSAGSSRSTLLPAALGAQHREAALAQPRARAERPLLVGLVGQQLAAVGGVVAALEALDVGRHLGGRGELDHARRAARPRRGRRARGARSSRPCAGWTRRHRRRAAATASRAPRRAACGGRERARAASRDPPRAAAPRRRPGRVASRRALRSVRAAGPRAAAYTSRPYLPALRSVPLEHETRFCTSADGVGIAYAVEGTGSPFVKAGNWMTHLDYDRQSPVWRHWVREFSRGHTLVRYDERGCGLSDREFEGTPTLDSYVDDLVAVVDTAGLEPSPCSACPAGGRSRSSTR